MLAACGGGGGGDSQSTLQPASSGGPGGGGAGDGGDGGPDDPSPPPTTSAPPELEPAWRMVQGNASHTGYVPVRVGRSAPAVAWEWPDAKDSASPPAINPVVTGHGSVYVATESYYCEATLYALDALSGAARWTRGFDDTCNFNPPAVGGDRVFVATSSGHEGAELWALHPGDGRQVFHTPFDNQWYEMPAPTVYDGAIYTNGGNGGVYAFDRAGAPLWASSAEDIDIQAPAVGADHVYHYSGTALSILDRASGRRLGTISDTPDPGTFASYMGAPVIGGHGNVIVHSRSSDGQGRVLSSFNVASKKREWSTAREYDTAPALANSLLYAGRNAGMAVDAIDEFTGEVLWSWSPAPGRGDTGFRHNIIVTDDLLLVSTDAAVYAVDLATRETAWRHDDPGQLALSGRFLYIVTGADTSDGRLVALDLAG